MKLKCSKCGRTLLILEYGKIEIKCPRCGHVHKIEIDKGKSIGKHL